MLITAGPTDGPLDAEWQSLVDHALTEREREVLMGLATEGLPAPAGFRESDDGVPCALAWPRARYALTDDEAPGLDG